MTGRVPMSPDSGKAPKNNEDRKNEIISFSNHAAEAIGTTPRPVVSQAGDGRPIVLTIYGPDGETGLALSPVRALELGKQLMERAVSSIKTGQWGKPWPG